MIRKQRKRKRILAGGLAVMMLYGILPASLLSAEENGRPSGEGTQEAPYVITDQQELAWIENDADAYYVLDRDIELSGDWEPLFHNVFSYNAFSGTLDGQGHVISGLNVPEEKGYKDAGLFGNIMSGEIKNLGIQILEGGEVAGTEYAGALAGQVYSFSDKKVRITNCYSEGGQVTGIGGSRTGGLIGTANRYVIEDCYSTCAVVETEEEHPVASMRLDQDEYQVVLEDKNGYFHGSVDIAAEYAPENAVSPEGWEASGEAADEGKINIGGGSSEFWVYIYDPGIYQIDFVIDGKSIAQTTVTAALENEEPETVYTVTCEGFGGISPDGRESGGRFGGLVGQAGSGEITSCYAAGEVRVQRVYSPEAISRATPYAVGGLVGYGDGRYDENTKIENCYFRGAISVELPEGSYYGSMSANVGGLVGENEFDISESFAQADISVTGEDVNAGGFAGYIGGSVDDCFANGMIVHTPYHPDSELYVMYVGGFAGVYSGMGSIGSSYAAVSVSSSVPAERIGGFAGLAERYYNDPGAGEIITDCYYDMDKSGCSDEGKGQGLGTAQMKSEGGMEGLDYANVWELRSGENDGYPVLRSMGETQGAIESTALSVQVPDPAQYKGCLMRLTNEETGGLTERYMTGQDIVRFLFLEPGDAYRLQVSLDDGTVLGEWTGITIEENKDNLFTADGLKLLRSVSVEILRPDGTVEEGASVYWYDAETGEYLLNGNTITSQLPGTRLAYRVILNDRASMEYRIPEQQEITVGEDKEQRVTVTLRDYATVTVSGTVECEDEPAPYVQVIFSTELPDGAGERSVSVYTDEEGGYETVVTSGKIRASVRDSSYWLYEEERDIARDAEWDMELESLDDTGIFLDITRVDAAEGESSGKSYKADGSREIINIYNETSECRLENYMVKYPDVFLLDPEEVNDGDTLRVEIADKENRCDTQEITFQLEKGTKESIEAVLTQRGNIRMQLKERYPENVTAALYGSDGRLAAWTDVYMGEAAFRSQEKGEYKVVLIRRADKGYPPSSLEELSGLGLEAGEDYLAMDADVSDGEVLLLQDLEVPLAQDEAALHLDMDQSSYTALDSAATFGMKFYASYEFKEEYRDKAEGITLEVSAPEEMELEGCSEVSEGVWDCHAAGSIYSYSFYADKPDGNGPYYSSAYVAYTLDGEKYRQCIGTVEIPGMSGEIQMYVPQKISDRKVTVSVHAPGYFGQEILIYDNGVQMGALNTGTGEVTFEIPDTGTYSVHEIRACTAGEKGEAFSDTHTLIYSEGSVAVEQIGLFEKYEGISAADVLWSNEQKAYISGYATLTSLPTEVVFMADFTDRSEEAVKNVEFIVQDTNGKIHILPGTYDAERQSWLAPMEIDYNCIPTEVGVSYLDNSGTDGMSPEEVNSIFNQWMAAEFDTEVPMDVSLDGVVADPELESIIDDMAADMGMEITSENEDGCEISLPDGTGTAEVRVEPYQGSEEELLAEGFQKLPYTDPYETASARSRTVSYVYMRQEEGVVEYVDKDLSEITIVDVTLDMKSMDPGVEPGWETAGILKDTAGKMMESFDENVMKEKALELEKYVGDQMQKAVSALPDSAAKRAYEQAAKLGQNALNKIKAAYPTISKWMDVYGGLANLWDWGSRWHRIFSNLGWLIDVEASVPDPAQCPIAAPEIASVRDDLNRQRRSLENQMYLLVADQAIAMSAKNGKVSPALLPVSMLTWMTDTFLDNQFQAQLTEIDYDIYQIRILCGEMPDPNLRITVQDTKRVEFEVLIDPSGYVYEAVPENRVEGVTATVFYREEKDKGDPVLWEAWKYGQENPQLTDREGRYAWDVPAGWWQVRYEKEGYITSYSDWLPVPPPQTEVNIPLVSMEAPAVEGVRFYTDGIDIWFTQYMDLSAADSEVLKITKGGNPVQGSWEPIEQKQSGTDPEVSYARGFRFIPASGELSGEYRADIGPARNYAGTLVDGMYSQSGTAVPRPEEIKVTAGETLANGGTADVTVQILPEGSGAGQKLYITEKTPGIAAASAQEITTDENGQAVFQVSAGLPGTAEFELSLECSEITAAFEVTVETPSPRVAAVEADPAGGTQPYGTEVTLNTDTPGARIYYTLDGTCPCIVDSPSRLLYEEPIVLTEDTTLIAYAVLEGYRDSATSRYVYTVTGDEGQETAVNGPDDIHLYANDPVNQSNEELKKYLDENVTVELIYGDGSTEEKNAAWTMIEGEWNSKGGTYVYEAEVGEHIVQVSVEVAPVYADVIMPDPIRIPVRAGGYHTVSELGLPESVPVIYSAEGMQKFEEPCAVSWAELPGTAGESITAEDSPYIVTGTPELPQWATAGETSEAVQKIHFYSEESEPGNQPEDPSGETPDGNGEGSGQNENDGAAAPENDNKNDNMAADTGDEKQLFLLWCSVMTGAAVLAVFIRKKQCDGRADKKERSAG